MQTDLESKKILKWGIWAYFLLLIFEGSLRKWVLPGLATPLLVVRDPIAIWLIYLSWKRNLLPTNIYITAMFIITVLSICAALIFGHGNLFVTIYGARILLIHFPLIFIIGKILDKEDVIKIGRVMLWISIPMVILIALQFYSPQSAWVNRGVGGDMEGAGFSGAMGFFRPPGTFSFTNGNTLFFSFLASFIIYFWVTISKINKIILIGASLALVISIPLSISRGLLFSVGVSLIFAIFALLRKPKNFFKIIIVGLVFIGLLFVLNEVEFFQTATEAFTNRFETASDFEGGIQGTLIDRYFGSFIDAFSGSSGMGFFGYGIGMGTNAGSQLLTGERAFLIAEGEWGRLIGEMGLLLGSAVILIRMLFCAEILLKSFKNLKSENLLPWLLLSFGLLNIPQGQWAQPTALGFAIVSGGLILASLNDPEVQDENIKST
ncbi:MAG TPA: hypothetical protein ENH91_14060 [Leeuwenhoekiella sp.]|nr:hypothetical protein [Leeuwenhoekiella sp.]